MMDDTNDTEANTLNGLIAVVIDSADFYEEAAKEATDSTLKGLFLTRSRERRPAIADLQARVRALGGTPEEKGTTLGAARRIYFDLKSWIAAGNQRVIEEVERSENHLTEKFEAALGAEVLSSATRQTIQRVYQAVKSDHDQIAAMKRATE